MSITTPDQICEILPVRSKFDGPAGVGLYLSPPGSGPQRIRYRNIRLVDDSEHDDGLYVGDYTPAADTFLNDATLAIAKTPDTNVAYELTAEYYDQFFWCDLRTHESGLENDSISRPAYLYCDEEGGIVPWIFGTAFVLDVVKRDAGGVLVRFEYVASIQGIPPIDFVLRQTSGPGSLIDATTNYKTNRFDYTIEQLGLEDGEAYTFDLIARAGSVEVVLGEGIAFTADASGPSRFEINVTEET